jgi:hypothetical protein
MFMKVGNTIFWVTSDGRRGLLQMEMTTETPELANLRGFSFSHDQVHLGPVLMPFGFPLVPSDEDLLREIRLFLEETERHLCTMEWDAMYRDLGGEG